MTASDATRLAVLIDSDTTTASVTTELQSSANWSEWSPMWM